MSEPKATTEATPAEPAVSLGRRRTAIKLTLVLAIGVVIVATPRVPGPYRAVAQPALAACWLGCVVLAVAAWKGIKLALRAPRDWLLLLLSVAGVLPCTLGGLVASLESCGGGGRYHTIGYKEKYIIRDMRSLIRAQAEYSLVNKGFNDSRLPCLSKPVSCIPNLPANTLPFFDDAYADRKQGFWGRYFGEEGWHIRTLHPGPAPSPLPTGASASSVLGFAYTVVPKEPGFSGIRGFCGDSTGLICFSRSGEAPPVRDGACEVTVNTCEVLE